MKVEKEKKKGKLEEYKKALNEFMETFMELITPKIKEATKALKKIKEKKKKEELNAEDLELIKGDYE